MSTSIDLFFDDDLNLLYDYLCNIEKIYTKLLNFENENDIEEVDYQYWKEQQSLNIENILGVCFIVAQNFITSIVTSSNRYLHQVPEYRSLNIEKNMLSGSKFSKNIPELDLLRFDLTEIKAIDAIANYFKHNDEWASRWHNNWHEEWQKKE